MADHDELIELINAYIKRNGRQAITGQVLNGVLRAMVEDLGNVDPIVVDSEMSETSENPVQNKVITEALQGVDKVFWAQYGVTTAQEIDQAIADGKLVATKYQDREYVLTRSESNTIHFAAMQNNALWWVRCYKTDDTWGNGQIVLQSVGDRVQTINENSDNSHYPSAKAVYDALPKDVVQYVEQTLTDAQKEQARQNIGATAPEIFWATYGTTTAAEIDQAVAAGKVVMCYNDLVYSLTNITSSYYYFYALSESENYYLRLQRSNNSWYKSIVYLQKVTERVNSIVGRETSTKYYPNTKAVADALGKMGVVSQTQTWSGGSNGDGYDYTLSNLVYGLIPQANIDLYEAAGATFNPTTGYFEIGNLKDISYKEMGDIYFVFGGAQMSLSSRSRAFGRVNVRSSIPIIQANGFSVDVSFMFYLSSVEQIIIDGVSNPTNISNFADSCINLKEVFSLGTRLVLPATGNSDPFKNCYSLERVEAVLKGSVSFAQSSRFSLASVVYLVNNATNTSAITITLHATAYARCQADTTSYTYNEQTYTGIISYAAAKNITIASA